MMETVAESKTEQRLLAKYKGYLERIDNDKSEISRLREERKNARKAKKNVFNSKIEALERDISDTERRLSKLEEMATIKRLVERKRAQLADDATLAGQMAQGRADSAILRRTKEKAAEQTCIIDMGKKLGIEVAFGKITKNGRNIDGLFDGKVLYINTSLLYEKRSHQSVKQ